MPKEFLRHPSGLVGGLLVGLFLLLAAAAPWVATHDPSAGALEDKNLAPLTRGHLLGTNELGQDVFSRLVHGARTSLAIGLGAVLFSMALGIPLGAAAGYFGGKWEALLMRGVDVLLAFPSILLAIAIVASLGRSLSNLILAVGIVGVPAFARQVRASVLVVKQEDYVLAARALGATWPRVLFLSVLPNCLGPILVLATLGLAGAILEAAGLGFVGLGPPVGQPEWGADINLGRKLFLAAPWAMVAPGLGIALATLGFNLLGDGLRDALDNN